LSHKPGKSANRIASMTGFARTEGQDGPLSWTVEARSVNGKSLEVRCRMPPGYDALDAVARAEAARILKRGNVNVNVTVQRAQTAAPLRLNRALLAQVIELAREIEGAGAAPPRLDALLAVRGIIETEEEQAESEAVRESRERAMSRSLTTALEQLAIARLSEGARLQTVLETHLAEIERLTEAAAATASLQPAALKERLRRQVSELVEASIGLAEERLVQETALLIARADVREELDRLRAHIAQARELVAEGAAVGRRFDFLCQEFNREANTLCSKSADVELTRIGLSLKAAIEQLREQVQNIE
jgi:uncharacterized protein (TIGR00255 family)